jgi:glutamine synthetase
LIQKGNHLAGVAQQVASVHGIDLPLSVNETILADASQQTSFRIQALRQIVEHHPEHAGIALDRARSAGIAALRVEAERFEEDQSVRVQKLKQLTTDANEMEIRQLAIRAIGAEKETSAIVLLTAWLDALEKDYEFLLKGDVFTKDIIDTWIGYKRDREIADIRSRPVPQEFFLYYDI